MSDTELEWLATSREAPPAPAKEPAKKRRTTWLLVAGWLAVVAAGMGVMAAYSARPGRAAAAPPRWPEGTRLPLAADAPTLVMIVHPRCSCSRASIGELSWLMTRLAGRVRAHVLFVRPEGTEVSWEQTDLWRSAEIISGVHLHQDLGGAEASRFGAFTSGQVFLYGRDGDLRFAGGITPSRSHFGPSVGRERIVSLVTSETADRDRSDVFGCPLTANQGEGLSSPRGPTTSL